jgi:formate dehydrogenase subunit gamma
LAQCDQFVRQARILRSIKTILHMQIERMEDPTMTSSMPTNGAVPELAGPLDAEWEARTRMICTEHGNDPANLLEILHALQEEFGFVTPALQPVLADILNVGKAEIHGVVSFYHDFRTKPAGKVVVKLCRAEACQSVGANALIDRILSKHGMDDFGTSSSGITIEPVYCLGNCALGPSAMVDERLLGRVSESSLDASISKSMKESLS